MRRRRRALQHICALAGPGTPGLWYGRLIGVLREARMGLKPAEKQRMSFPGCSLRRSQHCFGAQVNRGMYAIAYTPTILHAHACFPVACEDAVSMKRTNELLHGLQILGTLRIQA